MLEEQGIEYTQSGVKTANDIDAPYTDNALATLEKVLLFVISSGDISNCRCECHRRRCCCCYYIPLTTVSISYQSLCLCIALQGSLLQ